MNSTNTKRYKASNYKAYNRKLLDTYDKTFWIPVFKIKDLDKSIIQDVQDDIDKINILDVGCATGRLLESLALSGAKHLYGTDIAPNILDKVREKADKLNVDIELKVADAEINIPWKDNFFDIVTLTGVYHHFINPNAALKEIYRVLKKNGQLIIVEPSFPIIMRQIINLYLKFFMHEGDHKFYRHGKITETTKTIGLVEVRKQKNIGRFMFKISYQK